MAQYINKAALLAEMEKEIKHIYAGREYVGISSNEENIVSGIQKAEDIINVIEAKDVDLMLHTIIAECCDWLAMNTNLNHDEIEGCRNLMLTVKEEQCKAQKGE